MADQARHLYEFGPFRLDAREGRLWRDGEVVSLTQKAFEVLLLLVSHSGRVVEKEEFINRIWPDTYVEEGILTVYVSVLRKALGDDRNGHKYIETVPKRGYRFVMSVREVPLEVAAPQSATTQAGVKEELSSQREAEGVGGVNGTPLPVSGAGVSGRSEAARATYEIEASPPDSPGGELARRTKRHRTKAALAVVALGLLTTFGLYKLGARNRSASPLQKMRIVRLTMNGRATAPALSPDGKYLAYALDEAGRQGIWLRHIATGSDALIVPPAEGVHHTLFLAAYAKLIFSPDGHYIYYSKVESKHAGVGAIYQVPVLGGAPRKIIEGVLAFLGGDPVAFALSPDGQRLAFARYDFTKGETTLTVANTDGSGEQRLTTHQAPEYLYSPAWSPDGKVIAGVLQGTDERGRYTNIVGVAAEGGAEKVITSQRWYVAGQIGWLADGRGLAAIVMEQVTSPLQIWHVSYPRGEVRKITNDLHRYRGVSLTADSRTLATVQEEMISRIWIIPGADAGRARQATSNKDDGRWGVAWTPDGEILYTSSAGGGLNLWAVNPATGQTRQLTTDGAMNQQPAASPDGRYVVFISGRAGSGVRNVWRMDADGGNFTRLTRGKSEWRPSCSPDGKWVVYHSLDAGGRFSLWKVPLEGGDPVRLTDQTTYNADVSPDGKMIACAYAAKPDTPHKLAVFSFDGGQPLRVFDLLPTAVDLFRWTPDSLALTYIDTLNGVSNIWKQPLSGGPPQQLTGFKSDQILSFDWTRDGKQLAIARGSFDSDIVLISDFW
jgi:Tol biopolymer transport system component/DNA-binding winged helix-turn-helix (wHTH) protein